MAIAQAICNSFKSEVMLGLHDLDTNTLKIALYADTATLGASTTVYSTSDEVTGTGYSAGGNTLAGAVVTLDGSTAIVDFTDTSWTTATFTARGALIYNSSSANRAIAVLDFGTNVSVSAGTFTIVFPAAVASTAIIRLA